MCDVDDFNEYHEWDYLFDNFVSPIDSDFYEIDPALPGVKSIEMTIGANGDIPALDRGILRLLEQSTLYVIGWRHLWAGGPEILHCEVPVRGEPMPLIPVFTRYHYADEAIFMNPSWLNCEVFALEWAQVCRDLERHEWLAINPWSSREFKLPPSARRREQAA
jgi:hypothetical protein